MGNFISLIVKYIYYCIIVRLASSLIDILFIKIENKIGYIIWKGRYCKNLDVVFGFIKVYYMGDKLGIRMPRIVLKNWDYTSYEYFFKRGYLFDVKEYWTDIFNSKNWIAPVLDAFIKLKEIVKIDFINVIVLFIVIAYKEPLWCSLIKKEILSSILFIKSINYKNFWITKYLFKMSFTQILNITFIIFIIILIVVMRPFRYRKIEKYETCFLEKENTKISDAVEYQIEVIKLLDDISKDVANNIKLANEIRKNFKRYWETIIDNTIDNGFDDIEDIIVPLLKFKSFKEKSVKLKNILQDMEEKNILKYYQEYNYEFKYELQQLKLFQYTEFPYHDITMIDKDVYVQALRSEINEIHKDNIRYKAFMKKNECGNDKNKKEYNNFLKNEKERLFNTIECPLVTALEYVCFYDAYKDKYTNRKFNYKKHSERYEKIKSLQDTLGKTKNILK